MLLDGRVLEFYKWDGEVKDLLQATRDVINETAEGWSREEKDQCLNETANSFKYAGALLRTMTGGAGGGHH